MSIENLIETIDGWAELDFSELPTLNFQYWLSHYLILSKEFTIEEAEEIATSVDVEMPPGSCTEAESDTLAASFAKVIVKMRAEIADKGFKDPTQAAIRIASKMSVKLNG